MLPWERSSLLGLVALHRIGVRMLLRTLALGAVVGAHGSCAIIEPGRYPAPTPPQLPFCVGPRLDAVARKTGRPCRAPSAIQTVVREERDAMRDCYDAALRRDRGAAGRVTFTTLIDAEGEAASVCVHQSEIADAEMLTCLSRIFADLEFGELEEGCGDAKVVYPIIFERAP
jgi:hypothetical protein